MSYSAVFSERALKELADSWKWYEDRQYGLGDQFSEAVIETTLQLENDPGKGLKRNKVFSEAIVNNFPFLIIYRTDEAVKIIFIHSIFHTRRNPKGKYKV